MPVSALVLAFVTAFLTSSGAAAGFNKSIIITNSCAYTMSPGISTSSTGSAAELDTTGVKLAPGEARAVQVPSGWSGHVWGRRMCSTTTENSGCFTGDFPEGMNAVSPVTLVQFSMDASGGTDVFAISLEDGYNLPVSVEPQGAAPEGRCTAVACALDLNIDCAPELLVSSPAAGSTDALACNSACLAFGGPRFCCTGDYGSPNACMPSAYSEQLKKACPHAITYAYDADPDTLFSCRAAGEDGICYTVTFCPAIPTSGRTPGTAGTNQQVSNGSTTPNTAGNGQVGTASASELSRISLIAAVLGLVTAVVGLLAAIYGAFNCCCR